MVQFLTLIAALSVTLSLLGCSKSMQQKFTAEAPSPYRHSAEAGDAEAQYKLGLAYAGNVESDKHRKEAIYWLCSAAVQSHKSAQYELGRLYVRSGATGDGELDNYASAYFWYTAAASQGHDEALDARAGVAEDMNATSILDAKQRATQWRRARCVEP